MRAAFAAAAALLAAPIALSGCAPQGEFPSLARRPAERDLSIEEPERPPAQVAADAALAARVAELRGQAGAGERAFEAAYGPAEAAVGRGGAPESESWVEAQQALSRLEAAREPTMQALGELDRLAIERAGAPTSGTDFTAINEAVAAVERMAVAQQERLDRLRARLSGR